MRHNKSMTGGPNLKKDYIFFCDAPLQRLSRWLRILGYECHDCPDLSSGRIIFPRELDELSVILTRQRSLINLATQLKLPGVIIMIVHNDWQSQVRQVIEALKLPKPLLRLERCLNCGERLRKVDKTSIQDQVPSYIYETQHNFCQCSSCHRIFWSGTHSRHLLSQIDQFYLPQHTGKGPMDHRGHREHRE